MSLDIHVDLSNATSQMQSIKYTFLITLLHIKLSQP